MSIAVAQPTVASILERALDGERITEDDAVALLRSRDLVAVGRVANELRNRKTDPDRVTFIIDRNINYTNVCVTDCDFCAFYRSPGDTREGYLLPKAVIFKKIEETLAIGGTGVLMQGGHHPDLGIEFYEDLFSSIKSRYRDPPALPVAARDPAHLATVEADGVGDALAPARRGARFAPGRRRRSPRRPRPRHHRAEEDELGRLARRDAPRAPARHVDDRDDDVRARRDARGARRAHAARARGAGRDRRLPRVHLVDLPARRQPPLGARRRRADADVVRLPPDARPSRGSTSTTCRTSSRRGSPRA